MAYPHGQDLCGLGFFKETIFSRLILKLDEAFLPEISLQTSSSEYMIGENFTWSNSTILVEDLIW